MTEPLAVMDAEGEPIEMVGLVTSFTVTLMVRVAELVPSLTCTSKLSEPM